MNLYLISQNKNEGYDTYDSAVVCAESEDKARRICPGEFYEIDENGDFWFVYADGKKENEGKGASGSWCCMEDVNVKLIGKAKEGSEVGVICASFNAG